MDSSYPSSPVTGPLFRGQRRASEVSIASQVSGMADSYTATNIANSKCSPSQKDTRSLTLSPPPLCRSTHTASAPLTLLSASLSPRPHPNMHGYFFLRCTDCFNNQANIIELLLFLTFCFSHISSVVRTAFLNVSFRNKFHRLNTIVIYIHIQLILVFLYHLAPMHKVLSTWYWYRYWYCCIPFYFKQTLLSIFSSHSIAASPSSFPVCPHSSSYFHVASLIC